MGKKRNLNGLPENLALSYLSTHGYYGGGYMADWINFVAKDKGFAEINIDILNKSIEPKEAEIKPLLADLDKLKGIINKELNKNGFEMSFIRRAILRFEIPIDSPTIKNAVHCHPLLEDENGKIYQPKKKIVETAYEVGFNPIKIEPTKTEKIKRNLFEKILRALK